MLAVTILSLLMLFTPGLQPQVQAYCSGSLTCYTINCGNYCNGEYGGISCSGPSQCFGDPCTNVCDPSPPSYGINCSGFADNICNGFGISCVDQNNNPITRDCVYVPNPTPTPPGATPPPSGPPAGWGGCGSCSTCGQPANQCVTDPLGNCLWDPGSCGGGPPPCNPSCPTDCGQSNGCGGTCPSTDSGAAGTPTISSPTNGGTAVADASGNITISWAATARADTYRLELYTSANPDVDWSTTTGALSGGDYSTYAKTRAFDISTTSQWISSQTGAAVSGAAWIGQDLSGAKHIVNVRLQQHPSSAAYRISSAIVQYSDDASSWVSAQTIALVNDGNLNSYDIVQTDAHRYWRLLANGNPTGNNRWYVYDLELRVAGEAASPTVIVSNPTSYSFQPAARDYTVRVRALNTTCVAGGQTSQWSRWVTFVATSPVSGLVYYDGNNTGTLTGGVCTGSGSSLPATSPDITTTGGALSGGNYSASYPPARAFDNNNTTYWASRQTGAGVKDVAWVGQNFGSGKEIRKFSIRQYNNSLNRVTKVHVEYSDNGSSWSTLEDISVANNGQTNSYFLNASAAHQYWRLRAATGVGAGRVWAVYEIEMFEISAVDLGTLTVVGQDYQTYTDQVTVLPDGTYSINLPYSNTGTNQVSLIIDQASEFICSCPIGCAYSGVNAPATGLDFYITDAREPWFQAIGGGIAAFGKEGVVITNPVSDLCTGSCDPYLIAQRDNEASSSGIVVTGGGDVDLDRATGLQTVQLDEDNTRRIGKVSPKVARENYAYFSRLYKLPASPASDFGDTAPDAQKPTGAPVNPGVEAYYHGGDLTILDPWQVDAAEVTVIFVNGNLNVKNTVLVTQTGFLAFIVSGDIIFDANIGHVDPTAGTANNSIVEGIYIADGILSFPSRGRDAGGDYKFVGEGTFVGWSGVELDRNYEDNFTRRVLNNNYQTEVFRYRPDFVVRTPDRMRSPRIRWQEVAP